MQSSKELQGEIRKPSSAISAKKQENSRMGKTGDLFKKMRDTKGTFHAKITTIKDGNGMDLIEAEDIKKRWQKYTESESESEVAQSCPTLCNPMDCSLSGSSVHGIFLARVLEWIAKIHRRSVQKRSS